MVVEYPAGKVLIRALVILAVVITIPVYTLMIKVILKGRKEVFNSSFFNVFVAIAFWDYLKLSFYFVVYGVPLWNILPQVYLPHGAMIATLGFWIYHVVDPPVAIGSMLLSANRALAVSKPLGYQAIWTPTVSKVIITLMSVLGPLCNIHVLWIKANYKQLPTSSLGVECMVLLGRGDLLGSFWDGIMPPNSTIIQLHFAVLSIHRTTFLVWYVVCFLVMTAALYQHRLKMKRRVAKVELTMSDRRQGKRATSNDATAKKQLADIKKQKAAHMSEFRLALVSVAIALVDLTRTAYMAYVVGHIWFAYEDLFRHYVILEVLLVATSLVNPWALLATSSKVRNQMRITITGGGQ